MTAKGYWIISQNVTDQAKYDAYRAANGAPLKRYGARFLARAGTFENPEGSARPRNTVIEFPSYQAALDCYRSPEYQAVMKLRAGGAEMDLVIVEGYDGPQPGE